MDISFLLDELVKSDKKIVRHTKAVEKAEKVSRKAEGIRPTPRAEKIIECGPDGLPIKPPMPADIAKRRVIHVCQDDKCQRPSGYRVIWKEGKLWVHGDYCSLHSIKRFNAEYTEGRKADLYYLPTK